MTMQFVMHAFHPMHFIMPAICPGAIYHACLSILVHLITPAFHHAHHGKSIKDGISDPNGNYGNTFSLWDQLFGTAIFTRQFPTEYGLQNDTNDKWSASWFYPLITSDKPESDIAKGFTKQNSTTLAPTEIHLEKGE